MDESSDLLHEKDGSRRTFDVSKFDHLIMEKAEEQDSPRYGKAMVNPLVCDLTMYHYWNNLYSC